MKLFNDGWLFSKNSRDSFEPVSIPHDWLIADTLNLYETSTGFYKKTFRTDSLEGKRVFIRFDGVMMDSALYVNDTQVGEWKYGYTAFEFEITENLLSAAENTLLLKVNYQSPCSRWYTGAGIYRDVFISVKNSCYFLSDGINVSPCKNDDGTWDVDVSAEVYTGGKDFDIRHSIIEAGDTGATDNLRITNARLWDISDPYLYHLKSELIVDGEVTDTAITRFGLRTIEFTTDDGFFLNGRKLKLNGVCMHHDLGALGAAVYKDALQRQLNILREMGVNSIRTAHNPPCKAFMDLCDETGVLVLSELLDIWKLPKSKYDYARFFDEWIERDVASWIRRDRNSPSVIMWSVGNEIYDTHADAEEGGNTLRRLIDLVRVHDPKNHAPVTLCSNYMLWENTQKCMELIKLVGYNYAEFLYDKHHSEFPNWSIYGAETCATTQSRGVYHFPLSKSVLSDDDLQCSALGNSSTSWGAKSVEDCLLTDLGYSYSSGQFLWSGQDYIGEPTPYHTKNSYLGHIDTAGFPKDSFYIIKAAWTDEPMVHLYPYWDFSPGQRVDVCVCSNMPKVELFLDGISLGERILGGRFTASWKVDFKSGTSLRAVAYDDDGNVAAEMTRKSFGDAFEFMCDYELFGELLFATIYAVDKDGNVVENANDRVTVTVDDGTLLGLDNGDSTDYEQYQGTVSRCLFSGKLLAIVKPDPGKTAVVSVQKDECDKPVRKIELLSDGFDITAKVYPDNAVYDVLQWRLTDDAGIDSHLGSLEVSPDFSFAKVIPKADGEVYVRCGVTNGREHTALYSCLPLLITGLGHSFFDPYTFISGGLCSSNTQLTNGNERGVATLRDGESHVIFSDLDFGEYGSDEITLGLFPLSRDPFEFEIWEGLPGSGKLLLSPLYDKGSIWNTYIDVMYTLPYRLTGVTTISLVFRQKVHIKGFKFTKKLKAFERLSASDNDGLNGDSYIIAGDAVEKIGNNVTILFDNMDFLDTGTASVSLCWRTVRERSSVQLLFDGENSETRIMLELPRADDYTEAVFDLKEVITAKNAVRLLFLPGCELDLKWIQFIETR